MRRPRRRCWRPAPRGLNPLHLRPAMRPRRPGSVRRWVRYSVRHRRTGRRTGRRNGAANGAAAGAAALAGAAESGAAFTAHGVTVPSPVSNGQENRLPIFEAVESDWFRRGKQVVDRSAPVPDTASVGWSSPGDAGWQAAEVAQAPVSAGYTEAGLPKRVPKANLVPGAAGSFAVPPSFGQARSATQARDRLASFQQGIRKARGRTREEPPTSVEADGAT